jgi:hypothetical protein
MGDGFEGGITGVGVWSGYLGGGREIPLPNKGRAGLGKWQGGGGRPWYARIPHVHWGETNKLRARHLPWQWR